MPDLPISNQQMAELMKIASTDTGKKLLNLLQAEKGPALRQALNRQDYSQAKKIITSFLQDPRAKDLLKQLGR